MFYCTRVVILFLPLEPPIWGFSKCGEFIKVPSSSKAGWITVHTGLFLLPQTTLYLSSLESPNASVSSLSFHMPSLPVLSLLSPGHHVRVCPSPALTHTSYQLSALLLSSPCLQLTILVLSLLPVDKLWATATQPSLTHLFSLPLLMTTVFILALTWTRPLWDPNSAWQPNVNDFYNGPQWLTC